ncbi:MAG TPA: circularly permuted type 2 ATP-grasp protein [Chthoniobacterales bacterium]
MRVQEPALEPGWNEVLDASGKPRPAYQAILHGFHRRADVRDLEERLEVTLRELGVTFELPAPDRRNSWFCDLLPQVFQEEEWQLVVRAFQQRVRAFECLLQDLYGKREILAEGVLPVPLVLGSPQYQRSAVEFPPTRGCFLHLSGLCLTRDPGGQLMVKNHYFSHPSGLSYMIQDRRLLARVLPEIFAGHAIASIADVPTKILMQLRAAARGSDPTAVLLTPGTFSAVYSEHSFLARRMGIPLVQGNDLAALNDKLFLRTVSGLERVDVIYSRLADPWLDPLVFRKDSRIGVAGLTQCLRRGHVAMVNPIGTQLADDRSLLHFSNVIIRYYLGEWPVLPTLPTYWLGDLDQREMVLDKLDGFQIRTLVGERVLPTNQPDVNLTEIRRLPHLFVAQPIHDSVETVCFVEGKRVRRNQDFLVYGLRNGAGFEVFDGALTRISATERGRTETEHGGGGKDTWVVREDGREAEAIQVASRRTSAPAGRRVTSRVAEAFYWMGRYLERAQHVAKIILTIETVEMEELTSAERKLYRPVWNRLLPPLEGSGRRGRRTIGNVKERYRVMLEKRSTGSVNAMVRISLANADGVREVISPEAWSALAALRGHFQRNRWRELTTEAEARKITRRLAEAVNALVPQFFNTAEQSMLADDGWRFCELGQHVERAGVSANATTGLVRSLADNLAPGQAREIELSAFLRLMSSRDAYRRIYQTRSEPALILEMIWQNRDMPRSVAYCLERCAQLVGAALPQSSQPAQYTLDFIDRLIHAVRRVDWYRFFVEKDSSFIEVQAPHRQELVDLIHDLLVQVQELHSVVTDNLLTHQNVVVEPQPKLF